MTSMNHPRRSTAGGIRSGMRAGLLLAAGAAAVTLVGVHQMGSTGDQRPLLSAAPTAPTPSTARVAPSITGGPAPAPFPDTRDRAAGDGARTPVTGPPPAAIAAPLVAAAPPPPRAPVAAPAVPASRPRVLAVRAAHPAAIDLQPPAIEETVDTGSPYSPLVTFTIENRGDTVALLGRATTTTPAFRITRDDCRGTTLGPGDMCHVTVQFQPPAPGHYAGELRLPVAGGPGVTARLEGDAR
jgi:HYDIN/CFA65/VesB-like, Ig-like domain